MKALGCDGSSSLSSWLENLGLHEYLHNFLASGYRSLECVKNLWELEIVNVSRSDQQGREKVYQRVKLALQPGKEKSRLKKKVSLLNFGVRLGLKVNFQIFRLQRALPSSQETSGKANKHQKNVEGTEDRRCRTAPVL